MRGRRSDVDSFHGSHVHNAIDHSREAEAALVMRQIGWIATGIDAWAAWEQQIRLRQSAIVGQWAQARVFSDRPISAEIRESTNSVMVEDQTVLGVHHAAIIDNLVTNIFGNNAAFQ